MDWPGLIKDILLLGLGFVVTILTLRIQTQKDKIKSIENQLSDMKYKMYHEVFALLYDAFKRQKELIDEKQFNIIERALDLKKDMVIYAPDEVLKKFFEWLEYISENPGDIKHFAIYLDLMIEIRKDMGHKNTKTTQEELLMSFLRSKKDFLEVKQKVFSK